MKIIIVTLDFIQNKRGAFWTRYTEGARELFVSKSYMFYDAKNMKDNLCCLYALFRLKSPVLFNKKRSFERCHVKSRI